MSLNSIKDVADHIIFIDGGSTDNTIKELYDRGFVNYENIKEDIEIKKLPLTIKRILIKRRYEHEHPGANGRARICYLDFIKKHFDGHYCLVLDPDEVVEKPENLKVMIKMCEEDNRLNDKSRSLACSIQMKHLIDGLGYEDIYYTHNEFNDQIGPHFVPQRFFRIDKDLFYEEREHPVLGSKTGIISDKTNHITIWHLAYALPNILSLKKRYNLHVQKSKMHSKEFLRWWYISRLEGSFPVQKIKLDELPKQIKDFFGIEEDELYYRDRVDMDKKYFIDAIQWKNYFRPKNALFCGCGAGQRVLSMSQLDVDAIGFDKSVWIVENTPYEDLKKQGRIEVGDIRKMEKFKQGKFDLVVCYDILEHLEEKDLDKTLKEVRRVGREDYVFSIPFIGHTDLYKDKTHKIFQSREWWKNKLIEIGFEIKDVPKHFQFIYQLIICKKGGKDDRTNI